LNTMAAYQLREEHFKAMDGSRDYSFRLRAKYILECVDCISNALKTKPSVAFYYGLLNRILDDALDLSLNKTQFSQYVKKSDYLKLIDTVLTLSDEGFAVHTKNNGRLYYVKANALLNKAEFCSGDKPIGRGSAESKKLAKEAYDAYKIASTSEDLESDYQKMAADQLSRLKDALKIKD